MQSHNGPVFVKLKIQSCKQISAQAASKTNTRLGRYEKYGPKMTSLCKIQIRDCLIN
jgi:hypothetical protein